MTAKYSSKTTISEVAGTELNAATKDEITLGAAQSNDADSSDERYPLADYIVHLAAQSARGTTPILYLMIVPEVNSTYPTTSTAEVFASYKAYTVDGQEVSWTLENASTAAVDLTVSGVRIPNGNYKVGVYFDMDSDLAATGNTINETRYSYVDV